MLFHVLDITPAAEPTPATKTALEQMTQGTLYNDFVTGLKADAGVRENDAVLSQLLNLGASGS